ncbi:MAG TPA: Crp/Fnr family transcriptional regulator [Chthonomonadaceae bacterium]|nr:Crp/Fnr family transcriptional regulator [Chthonomonadaceae bacterium]
MPVDPTVLRTVRLFDGMPADQFALISERGRLRAYKPETYVINQDDTGETLFLIMKGIVKVSLTRPDGREVFLAALAQGDHFGELSLIDSKYRSANVVTQEDTILLLLDRALFDQLTHCRQFMLNLLASLAARSRRGNERVANLATMSVQGLVAHHILEFAQLYGQRTGGGTDITIPIRITQNDLADVVGASRERVNHVMKHFKESGSISVNGQYRITVHRVADLRRCVELQ